MAKRQQPNPIRPVHRSMLGSQTWTRPPVNMMAMPIPHDLKYGLTEIALSIFTDTINAGKTFQDAILAVYISGIENSASARRES